jgi:hypothetical protein
MKRVSTGTRDREAAQEFAIAKERRCARLESTRKRVYFAQVVPAGPIKIGVARNVALRFGQLQATNHEQLRLLASEPGDELLERDLHVRFSPFHVRGEWFEPAPDLLMYIADVVLRQVVDDDSAARAKTAAALRQLADQLDVAPSAQRSA